MHRGLGHAELLSSGADGGAVFRYVLREPHGALLDVSPHIHHSRLIVVDYMRRSPAIMLAPRRAAW